MTGSSPRPKKISNRSKTLIRLLLQPIALQVPFDSDAQELLTHISAAPRMSGQLPLA